MLIFVFWQEPVNYLERFITDNSLLSISIFIFLMFISTVFAPLTVLPFVPFVAILLGSFNTAIYSMVGWTLGSVVSFLIARNLGKPVLFKFVSKKDIIKYHKYIPEDVNFWWIVFLRMVIPVDILSYVVGLLTNMSLWKYTLATIIGITPFSFIFSYGFDIVLLKNKTAVFLAGLFLVVILPLIWYFHRKRKI
jgi:uncharacterized membrane protein YdjX (TVP38/TMEM64 family)